MKKFALLFTLLVILSGCTGSTVMLLTGCTEAAAADVVPPVEVPILMYHHFTEEPPATHSADLCSAARFWEHLTALQDAGYTTVTFADLLAYVEEGVPLPEKPILLTSDDGYTSVLTLALPQLREFGMTMSVGIIGSMMGRDTGLAHFTIDDWAAEMAHGWEDGPEPLELVSHTWDLHNWNDVERGVLTTSGALSDRFPADAARMQEIATLNQTVFVYPYGKHSRDSEATLARLGYKITVTTKGGIARITREDMDCLRGLSRIGVHDGITGEELLDILEAG